MRMKKRREVESGFLRQIGEVREDDSHGALLLIGWLSSAPLPPLLLCPCLLMTHQQCPLPIASTSAYAHDAHDLGTPLSVVFTTVPGSPARRLTRSSGAPAGRKFPVNYLTEKFWSRPSVWPHPSVRREDPTDNLAKITISNVPSISGFGGHLVKAATLGGIPSPTMLFMTCFFMPAQVQRKVLEVRAMSRNLGR
ncbi:hypothetical protein R1sor_020101 [Riccia sorocarpa]|uniref:Uncharacterized protein n=1 Tax=Riccia sorocarpa TaxID=122646 RepID=A0ABD3IKN9_9MARC